MLRKNDEKYGVIPETLNLESGGKVGGNETQVEEYNERERGR